MKEVRGGPLTTTEPAESGARENAPARTLARQIGLFDASMVVVGGIIGAGIFMNPSVVARVLGDGFWILGVWVLGGLIALSGAFVYAELSGERPWVGGQYAFYKEAFHPSIAFLYGWCLLWVGHSGGMAAVAVTFAKYFRELTGWAVADQPLALGALGALTIVNCLGVRLGTFVQSALTVLKSAAIALLVFCGFVFGVPNGARPDPELSAMTAAAAPGAVLVILGAAMVPVLFAYGGWQTACFVAGEVREPRRNMPRALVLGLAGVIVLYVSVNAVCLFVLGAKGLADTSTPASDVMRQAIGEHGARWISAGIVVSTLGFLSQGMLTGPRVYYAMAKDGVFFRPFGRLHAVSGVPVAAIALQGIVAMIIALSGRYDQILNYVVSVDFIFYGLTAVCVFVFRARAAGGGNGASNAESAGPVEGCHADTALYLGTAKTVRTFRVPGHPWTTLFFMAGCWGVVLSLVWRHATDSLIGFAILAAGIPVYYLWRPKKLVG